MKDQLSMEVLELLAKGMTNMEIAEKLFLSKRTVEGHRQSLIDKFEVHNAAELVYLCIRAGLLSEYPLGFISSQISDRC